MISGSFLEEFNPRYQRNNKRSGQKNLRCFPVCNEGGHLASGFCGRPISCVVEGLQVPKGHLIAAWGEFVEDNSDNQSRAGCKVAMTELMEHERTRTKPLEKLLRGEVVVDPSRSDSVKVVFNRQLLGWHYQWVSTKHTCDMFHCFKAHIYYRAVDSNDLVYAGSVLGPKFQIYSRRRQRGVATADGTCAKTAAQKTMTTGKVKSENTKAGNKRKNEIVLEAPKKLKGEITSEGPGTFSVPPMSVQHFLGTIQQHNMTETWKPPDFMNGPNPTPSEFSPVFAPGMESLVSVVSVEKKVDTFKKIAEMDRNRTLDRLAQFTFHFSSGQEPGALSSPSTPLTDNMEEFDPQFSVGMKNPLEQETSLEKYFTPGQEVEDVKVNSQVVVDGQKGMDKLREVLKEHGTVKDDAYIQQIIDSINSISECTLKMGRNNAGFASVYKRWSSPDGLRRLKQQILKEQDLNFTWTREHEDETYNVENPSENVEDSIYAQVRHNFRRLVLQACSFTNTDLRMFEEPMLLAAKYGVLCPDPYYPPKLRDAAFIHLQLYGNLDKLPERDYGARAKMFASPEQQREFAKDLLVFKRGIFRRLICNRIIQEQKNKHLTDPNCAPIAPEYDVNGVWLAMDPLEGSQAAEKMYHGMTQMMSGMTGSPLGPFFFRLFHSMFSKMDITITSKAIRLEGQKVLLADPTLIVPLSGPPMAFRAPLPLPMETMSGERLVMGFTAYEAENNLHTINIVLGGAAMPQHFAKLMSFRKSVEKDEDDGTSTTAKNIAKFLGAPSDDPQKQPEMRVLKRIEIVAGNRQMILLKHVLTLFRPGEAPRMDNVDELNTLVTGAHEGKEILTFSNRFMRTYLDPSDNDLILDLL
mmetsp:Transcript_19064/g.31217  ORF Transcript_19064/g.31217 Transcript_19064/m.31217 type:complete len:863 (+) Transcript_19064:435-3023(+)|eukprot:CAMPEP_0203758042 /NCGR_PEP_ID=MMETSP0098-20131031/10821_1 /ASSEMBLY_ACC=CAM_ASM_000208 /TAXON_ID=96639 /ORGANISM=" , Strain NY0313808BC1" /LENGTH=862 /DNA_ID=CAMNT_0050650289 /DNA_START=2177 /DNA_END=4765 /DNA_ORIENTATION=-